VTPTTTRASGLPQALAGTAAGVLRPVDGREVYVQPQAEFLRLEERGLLTGCDWLLREGATLATWGWLDANLEAAAFGVVAADYGPDHAVLMGLSAARPHGANSARARRGCGGSPEATSGAEPR